MKKLPTKYSLHETGYGNEVPVEQYFVHKFDAIPSKMSNGLKKYSADIFPHLLSNGFKSVSEQIITGKRYDKPSNTYVLIHNNKHVIITLKGTNDKSYGVYFEIVMNYDSNLGDSYFYIDFFKLNEFVFELKKSGINLVKSDMGHLDIEEYDLNIPDMNLELNYGKEFLKIHELIVKRLNTPHDKGIILFHGDPGTGKTSYIKYLTRMIIEKEILFIPPSMAESLSEPSIIPFLMEHKNSILIVEDAERVIADRETNGSSAGVSNILNLTDGILGDCLNIQIIATFNMKREKIDNALLRKGRLIAEHKFQNLSLIDTKKLLKYIGKKNNVEKGMCLADIYNMDEEFYRTDNKSQIGFNI